MIEIDPGQTVEVDDDDTHPFENHSAFAYLCDDHISNETSSHHNARHDVEIKTLPVEIDRSNDDDVERAQGELLYTLGGMVDDHCLRWLIESGESRLDVVEPDALEDWLVDSVIDSNIASRNDCGANVLIDHELGAFIKRRDPDDNRLLQLGPLSTRLYPINRGGQIDQGLYVVVAHPHVVQMTSRAVIRMSSHTLGRTEFLTASCTFSYAPRVAAHPGSVRIARVRFESHGAWAQAYRKAALAAPLPAESFRG